MSVATPPGATWWRTKAAPPHPALQHWRTKPRRASTRCFSNAENGSVAVHFQLPYHCKYGQRLCLIGSSANLGAWNVDQAVPMEWTEGDVWTCELQLPADGGVELEYKYVVRHERDKTAVRWKEGANFYLQVPTQGQLRVLDTWDESARQVEVLEKHALEAQRALEGQQAPASAAAGATVAAAVAPPAPPLGAAPEPALAPMAAENPAVMTVKRHRRKKVDEDEEAAAAISKAADKAMQQLDSAVSKSLDLLSVTNDPATPELLATDRQVAAAARRVATMNKALDAAKEAKLLPPTGIKTRRRRKDGQS